MEILHNRKVDFYFILKAIFKIQINILITHFCRTLYIYMDDSVFSNISKNFTFRMI